MTLAGPNAISLNPKLDAVSLARQFADNGRLQIADFLMPDAAEALRTHLCGRTDWRHVINGDSQIFEIPADQYDALPVAERQRIEEAMFAKAGHGFQFQFDTIRVPDGRAARLASASPIDVFAQLMSAPATLALLRTITGAASIAFADAQATRYRKGDFLTRHDDAVAGKNRQLAYVLGMTPGWQAEWGGLLLFNDPDGGVIDVVTPRFNSLSLFAVRQPHSVSYIAPYAPMERLSLTGWLRAEPPPD